MYKPAEKLLLPPILKQELEIPTPQSSKMASNLGKRKRRAVAPGNDEAEEEDTAALLEAQEVFRRHFEAQFQPLPEVEKVKVVEEEEEEEYDDAEEEEESEWDGISEDENEVRVVEHTDSYARMAAMSKEQLKSFMVLTIPPLFTMQFLIVYRHQNHQQAHPVHQYYETK